MGRMYDSRVARPARQADVGRYREAALDMYRRSSQIWTDLHERGLLNPTDTARVGAAALAVSRAEAALSARGGASGGRTDRE